MADDGFRDFSSIPTGIRRHALIWYRVDCDFGVFGVGFGRRIAGNTTTDTLGESKAPGKVCLKPLAAS